MVNPARGEVSLRIGDTEHTLCLTLGALAEIEALPRDAERLSAATLLRVLQALLRGGGSVLSAAELEAAPINLNEAARAVAACFEAGE
jgi:hypothetical protein